jgi:hypothetical protein
LAACLRHASRANLLRFLLRKASDGQAGIELVRRSSYEVRSGGGSGKRVSNTLVTYLEDGDSPEKSGLIPDGNGGSYDIPI